MGARSLLPEHQAEPVARHSEFSSRLKRLDEISLLLRLLPPSSPPSSPSSLIVAALANPSMPHRRKTKSISFVVSSSGLLLPSPPPISSSDLFRRLLLRRKRSTSSSTYYPPRPHASFLHTWILVLPRTQLQPSIRNSTRSSPGQGEYSNKQRHVPRLKRQHPTRSMRVDNGTHYEPTRRQD